MKFSLPKKSRAFTLIEIMLAMAVFMLVIAAIFTTWTLIMRSAQVSAETAGRAQRERVTMHTLENSLMCIQSFQASQKYYSFIVKNGDDAMLSFASRLPSVFPRNGEFGDFNLRRLTYTLEPGDDHENNLVLRQNPILMDMSPDEEKYPLILAKNVKKFVVECWDTNQMEWVDEWDNTNSIPPMLRVELVFGNTVGKAASSSSSAASDFSVVRAFSIPSEMMPVAVQRGLGPGAPAPGASAPGLAIPIPGGAK